VTKLIYMSAPVRPLEGETLESNLARGRRWYKFLQLTAGDHAVFLAPWILSCELFDDDSPEQRKAGMARQMEIIARCDEVWLVGGRVSSGMAAEKEAVLKLSRTCIDLTDAGPEPGQNIVAAVQAWAACVQHGRTLVWRKP